MSPPRTLAWDGGDLDGVWDEIVWSGAGPDDVTRAAERLQPHLRPGGRLIVRRPRRPRATARALRPYFEGGTPHGRKRYVPVRVQRDADGRFIEAYRRGPGLQASHFDELAAEYDEEIPAHLVEHYLDNKIRRLEAAGASGLGLEVGCGQGHYARATKQRLDARIVATDRSMPSLRAARRHGPLEPAAADVLALPFCDGAFDFVYTVNMLHHLKRGEQGAALVELARVVRPGGAILVFEINVRNPVFRFYMRHVFPRTRRIDRGDEEFLDPCRLPVGHGVDVEAIDHYTFMPDFAPKWALRPLRRIESWLERGPLCTWSIHYTVTLRKR